MDWTQVLAIVGANFALLLGFMGTVIGMFLWGRTEAREDRKNTEAILQSIQNEMKDFHGRMCAIEEKRRG
jgi:hypothetical protein